jgi:hypothetical protein
MALEAPEALERVSATLLTLGFSAAANGGRMSSLRTMLGLSADIGNESLPEYLRRTTRPAPPPPPDPLDAELRENTARVKAQAAIDHEEMRLRLLARRNQIEQAAVMTRDPNIAQQDAQRRHKP